MIAVVDAKELQTFGVDAGDDAETGLVGGFEDLCFALQGRSSAWEVRA